MTTAVDARTVRLREKTLKVERTYRLQYTSRDQASLDIVNWIEGFYNEKRLHSAIDY